MIACVNMLQILMTDSLRACIYERLFDKHVASEVPPGDLAGSVAFVRVHSSTHGTRRIYCIIIGSVVVCV